MMRMAGGRGQGMSEIESRSLPELGSRDHSLGQMHCGRDLILGAGH